MEDTKVHPGEVILYTMTLANMNNFPIRDLGLIDEILPGDGRTFSANSLHNPFGGKVFDYAGESLNCSF